MGSLQTFCFTAASGFVLANMRSSWPCTQSVVLDFRDRPPQKGLRGVSISERGLGKRETLPRLGCRGLDQTRQSLLLHNRASHRQSCGRRCDPWCRWPLARAR